MDAIISSTAGTIMNPMPGAALESKPETDAAVAAAPGSPEISSLPAWLTPLLLAGLAAIAGLIALVGWLLMKPTAAAAVPPVQQVAIHEPINEASLPRAVEKPLGREESPEEPQDRPPPPRRSESIPLQRRMRVVLSEPEAPTIMPMPMHQPMPAEVSPGMRLQAPVRWTVEPARPEAVNVMMPIEVAKIDDGAILHSIRRLQFANAAPKSLKLAVTPVSHDDLGSVLTRMGAGYAFTKLRKEDLYSFDTLKKHDVVFLTCADMYAQDFQAALPLRKFVAHGGTLYASDLRGDLLQAAFPEFRAKTPMVPAVPQTIETSVVETGLQSYLGRKAIPLNFESPDWRPAPFDPFKVTVCLKGTYRNNLGQSLPAALLVKFRFQKGTVIFTSFHHVKNDSEIVRKLLDYLVFASVNARTESRVKELMQQAQFSTREMRPALMSAGSKLESTYRHPGGNLQIALGFEHLGAQLKLTLRSPSGQVIEYADHSIYLIAIPKGEPGIWSYTVTPIELPHPNFPLIVGIGGGKS